MLSGKPWDDDEGDGAMPTPPPVPEAPDTVFVPRAAAHHTPSPDTLAHKAERLTDADLDAAIRSALAGDFAAAELRLSRVNPPCVMHPVMRQPKVHRPFQYSRRGAGLQAKKVSPWRR
jgi:hypothetical protein